MDELLHTAVGQGSLQAPMDSTAIFKRHNLDQQFGGLFAINATQRLFNAGQTGGVHRQHIVAHRQQQLALAASAAVTTRLATPTATPTYSTRAMLDSPSGFTPSGSVSAARTLQDEIWAAKIAAATRGGAGGVASPMLNSRLGTPTSSVMDSSSLNSKLNPSVYSHPSVQDPVLMTPKAYPLSVLGGKKENIDLTSSGAFFDPKAVNKLRKDQLKQSDMISQLQREMKMGQIGSSPSTPQGTAHNLQSILSGSSEISSSSGSNNHLNMVNPSAASGQSPSKPSGNGSSNSLAAATTAARTTSTSSSSGYRSDNSIGSESKELSALNVSPAHHTSVSGLIDKSKHRNSIPSAVVSSLAVPGVSVHPSGLRVKD